MAKPQHNPIPIEIEVEGSYASGVIHFSKLNVENWLESQGVDENLIPILKFPVAILKNMYVEDEDRGLGIGTDLLQNFLYESKYNGAKSVILISDEAQEQEQGFNLTNWYIRKGFKIIGIDNAGYPVCFQILK